MKSITMQTFGYVYLMNGKDIYSDTTVTGTRIKAFVSSIEEGYDKIVSKLTKSGAVNERSCWQDSINACIKKKEW